MNYDIAIIGAGPGGYVAAIRAAQFGAKVALIERDQIGGVCLNRGCIPTKAMIASSHALFAVRRASEYGVIASAPSIDMQKVQARKEGIVTGLREGIGKLLKANKIEIINGNASFDGKNKLQVDGGELVTKNTLIATGSSWIDLPNITRDGKCIVTSDEALLWTEVPQSLVIVGGGVIGCEFACMMSAFGTKVQIVEATPSILPPVEAAISRLLARSMKAAGIEIITSTTVDGAVAQNDGISCKLSSGEELSAEKMIVAVGRRPLTQGLNLEAAGVALDERGFIKVDSRFETSTDGIFAIGDVIGGPMLAHAASAEGIAAVEGISGKSHEYDPSLCPAPIFTHPEIASVGRTAEDLKKSGVEIKTGRFPYAACGKALCDGDAEGQAIIHADAGTGKILGVHIIGHDATLLIAEAALALKEGLAADEFASTIRTHPTLSEILGEAAEDVDGRAIHKAVR